MEAITETYLEAQLKDVQVRLNAIESKIDQILAYHADVVREVVPIVEAFQQVKESPMLKMLLPT